MITEVANLEVKPGLETAFENDFDLATSIIAGAEGYISHQLLRGVEETNRYVLLVKWESVGSHKVTFRTSPEYQKWKELLHHYYVGTPTVDYFKKVHEGER